MNLQACDSADRKVDGFTEAQCRQVIRTFERQRWVITGSGMFHETELDYPPDTLYSMPFNLERIKNIAYDICRFFEWNTSKKYSSYAGKHVIEHARSAFRHHGHDTYVSNGEFIFAALMLRVAHEKIPTCINLALYMRPRKGVDELVRRLAYSSLTLKRVRDERDDE